LCRLVFIPAPANTHEISLKLGALAAPPCSPAHPPAPPPGKPATASRPPRAPAGRSKQLNKLADEYYDALARFDPVSASESGDNRFIDQIGMSIAPKNAPNSSRCTKAI
jgi:hypothetical protein